MTHADMLFGYSLPISFATLAHAYIHPHNYSPQSQKCGCCHVDHTVHLNLHKKKS